MDRQLFNKLKNFWGSFAEIARRSKITSQSVKYILRDAKWDNPDVIKHANDVLDERKAKMKALLSNG